MKNNMQIPTNFIIYIIIFIFVFYLAPRRAMNGRKGGQKEDSGRKGGQIHVLLRVEEDGGQSAQKEDCPP